MSGVVRGLNQAAGAVRAVSSISRNLGALAQTVGLSRTIDPWASGFVPPFLQGAPGATWGSAEWWQQLQPGSWRGVPFVLDAGETRAGRRTAVHEYPYRDTAWVEDLGKLPRRFAIQAYLTGDDVYQQRNALVAQCEKPGPGTLVHPTFGALQCVLLDFAVSDRRERGRYIEVALSFIVAGEVQYPTIGNAPGNWVISATEKLNSAVAGDLSMVLTPIPVIPAAAAQIGGFLDMAKATVNDASRIMGSVRGLAGYFGRYATGNLSRMLNPLSTVQSALAGATTLRTSVMNASANVANLVTRL
jgi:prophage DNA circulation protein